MFAYVQPFGLFDHSLKAVQKIDILEETKHTLHTILWMCHFNFVSTRRDTLRINPKRSNQRKYHSFADILENSCSPYFFKIVKSWLIFNLHTKTSKYWKSISQEKSHAGTLQNKELLENLCRFCFFKYA